MKLVNLDGGFTAHSLRLGRGLIAAQRSIRCRFRGASIAKAALALAICVLAQISGAAPAAFAYQGVIKEIDGSVPANKNRVIEFRIYDGPITQNALWGRACNVLLDANGLFNTSIADSSGSPIDGVTSTGLAQILANNSGTTLYIGLKVDGSSGEITPRQALMAVPYAIQAADAASASGDFTVAGRTTTSTLEVTGNTTLQSVSAANLSVSGNVSLSTAGSFSGYGTIPVGGIIMWSGSANNIPDGWKLCNGENNTPNLKGRFIVGYDPNDSDYNSVGMTGGEKKHTLTIKEMPAHNHDYKFKGADLKASYDDDNYFYNQHANFDKNSNTKTTENTGGDQPHENRPPYYVLCFIMRVK